MYFLIEVGVWVAVRFVINLFGSFLTKIFKGIVANKPPEVQELSFVQERNVSVSHS